MVRSSLHLLAVVYCAALSSPVIAADVRPDRYFAEFANLTTEIAPEVTEWHDLTAQPKVNGKPIWDAGNPLRCLIETTLRPASLPSAFVEFFGGDLLPGEVHEFSSGAESPYRRELPHLSIDVRAEWNLPDTLRGSRVRVLTQFLKRVVWERRSADRYVPGTLYYKDGRELKFRAARWNPQSITFLLEQETTEVPFADMAELHLPNPDPWDSYLDQLAILSPEGTAALMRWETTTGLRVTSSQERLQARAIGDAGNPDTWHHLLQPAWSLDGLWIRHRTVRVRRHFPIHQPPLSLLDPVAVSQKSTFGGRAVWRKDRNVQGGVLKSGGHPFADGLGMQAETIWTCPVPAFARQWRSRIGLDALAGDGGCAQGWILADQNPTPLFKSPVLIGTTAVTDTGWVALPPGMKTLTLVADTAHTGRPAGADPYDIRDLVNWLEPEWQLDLATIQTELRTRAKRFAPAWEGWALEQPDLVPLRLVNSWQTDPATPEYRLAVGARVPFLTWSRRVQLGPQQRWLMLAVSRPADPIATASQLQVRIEGEAVGDFEVPVKALPTTVDPLLVPLQKWQGREVTIEVTHLPSGPQAFIEWDGVALLDRHPGVRMLFDDENQLVGELIPEAGTARLDHSDPYTGTADLEVTLADVGSPQLPGMSFPIRRDPRLGEYRYLIYAWKKTGGTRIALRLAQEGRWGPDMMIDDPLSFRYDAGTGEKSHLGARRVDGVLPEKWTVVTRDLFADFGSFNLTGLGFSAVDGGTARFDQIYLARTAPDAARGPEQMLTQPKILFDDQFFLKLDGHPMLTLDTATPYSGSRAIKITPGVALNHIIPGWSFMIRENPGPEEYRYLRFAWRKSGGKQILLSLANQGQWGADTTSTASTLRYAAGELANPLSAVHISTELPTEWTVVTRDLFADFGEITLTGMGIQTGEGDFAMFDQIQLGRTVKDLADPIRPIDPSATLR